MYRFHVRGRLDTNWSQHLDGMAIEPQEDGTTVLIGSIVDQAALYGMIIRIRDLGLTLLSVSRVDKRSERKSSE